MTTVCPGCGHGASPQALFCPECGRSLRTAPHPPRRVEPPRRRGRAGPVPRLGQGAEGETIRPRPAAQVARRPMAFPTTIGSAMIIAGSVTILVGALTMRIPDDPLTVWGYGGDRWLPLTCGALMVVLSLVGMSSPSRLLRATLRLGAIAAAAVAIIDSRRLDGAPAGAGFGLTLVGVLLAVGGTLLSEER